MTVSRGWDRVDKGEILAPWLRAVKIYVTFLQNWVRFAATSKGLRRYRADKLAWLNTSQNVSCVMKLLGFDLLTLEACR